jgi:protocatechuate 3,4-dioxygenase beta subunit
MLLRMIVTGFLLVTVVACVPVTLPAQSGGESEQSTAQTGDELCDVAPTSRDQQGPYYSEGSPMRDSLVEEDMAGRPIIVSGRVLDADCTPIVGAKVDFWQADSAGVYDNVGYRLRGHTLTDSAGEYAIETIEPGPYTGRPPHIHVKVFDADDRELLTTQLYFPGEEGSLSGGVPQDLLVRLEAGQGDVANAPFDFVVRR